MRNERAIVGAAGAGVLLVVFCLPCPAAADESNNGEGTVPGILGLGQPRSAGYASAAGSAVEGFALSVAPGRKGIEPHLALSYSSTFGSAVELGIGWSLPIGNIQRSPARGIPSGSGVDEFVFNLAGASDVLIPQGGGAYRARFETAARTHQFLGDHWEVRDGRGTLYRFGGSPDTRIDGLEWMLDLVQDTAGNTLTISYTSDGNYFYPSEIRYSGNAGTGDAGAARVTFDYDTSRPDQTISYALGVEQRRHLILRHVSSFVSGLLVRRYELSYVESPTTHRPLLASVDLVGTDDASRLRARTYAYQTAHPGFATTAVSDAFPIAFLDTDGRDTGARTADVNGDGFLDVLDNGTTVWLGDGHDHFTPDPGFSASLVATGVHFIDGNKLDTGTRIIDVNGDLRPDLVVGAAASRRVFLNTGAGWEGASPRSQAYSTSLAGIHEFPTTKVKFTDPRCAPDAGTPDAGADGGVDCEATTNVREELAFIGANGQATGATLADVNGDGLVDIVWSFATTETVFGLTVDGGIFGGSTLSLVPVTVHAVYLNQGDGWTRSDPYSTSLAAVPPFVSDTQPQAFDVLDINGDGAADIVNTGTGSPDPRAVWLSTGSGWTLNADYTASLRATQAVSLDGGKAQGLVPVDFNRDGLLDYVRVDESVRVAYRNTGLGFVEDVGEEAILSAFGVTFADGDGNSLGFDFQDVDGNGVVDLIRNRAGQGNQIWHADGTIADLLHSATSGLGEVTTFGYTPSTAFDNRGTDMLQHLPSILETVTSMTRSDGRGHTFLSTVAYAGGLFDQARGEAARFRSFATASTVDSRGVLTTRRFAQTEALAGSVTANETFDGPTLARETTATYATRNAGVGVTQILLSQADDITNDPGGTQHTRIRYSYDEDLNTIEVDKDGDVAVSGDEGKTVFRYAKNRAAGIVAALSATLVFDASGVLRSQGVVLYDGSATEGVVSLGNATKLVDSVQLPGSTAVTKSIEYDDIGNVTAVVDRNGGRTTFAYDDTRTFQTKAVDPSGRTKTSVFDARFGVSIADTDANGRTTSRLLDTFGRLVRETRPGDEASPNGTRSLTYSPLGDATAEFVKVSLTETPGQPGTLDSTVFFDGFEQRYRAVTEGATGAPVTVLSEFDDAGNVVTQSRPFFAADPVLLDTTTRDALRRVVTIVNARGDTMTTTYRGRQRDVVDARGNKTTVTTDAYGHIVEEDQFVGGKTLVTLTAFDVLGNKVRVQDPAGEVTTIDFDSLGRRVKVVDPSMGTFSYAYDGNGNLIAQDSPAGHMALEYNASNDLTKKRLPDGHVFTFETGDASTNGVGRLSRVQDNAGLLELSYDARGRVAERRRTFDGRTYVTGFARDSMGRLRKLTYPDGFAANYSYDAGGLVQSITGSDGQTIVDGLQYDAAGHMLASRFQNGVSSAYSYDPVGLMKTIDTTNTHHAVFQKLALDYDADWNVLSITDGQRSSRSQAFTYDELNRLTHATGGYGDLTFAYDELGNLVRKDDLVFARDPVRKQQVNCAIDLGLATGGPNGLGGDARFVACLATLLAPGSGLSPVDVAKVQTIQNRANRSGRHGDSFLMSYDAAGNMTTKDNRELEYDPEGRLLAVDKDLDDHGHQQDLERNIYDFAGSRVARTDEGHQSTVFIDDVYEEDHASGGHARKHVRIANALVATISVPRSQVDLISHAPVGLEVDGPTRGLSCTIAGADGGPGLGRALAEIALVAAVLVGRSRRRGRWSRLRAAGRTGFQVLAASARRVARRPGPGGTSIVLVLALITQVGPRANANNPPPHDQRFYYHLDHVGNTNVITDDAGQEFERREYKPFGEQFVRSGSGQLEISFNGHQFDDDVGLYYFGARHYDPMLGRFTSADTQVANDSPQALHRYAFNLNNPLRYIDLDGHSIFSDAWDWISNNFVPILIGAVLIAAAVVVIVVTGGTAAPLLALVAAGALAGAGLAIIIASAVYKGLTVGDYVVIALAGAIVGASIGLAVGILTGAAGAAALPAYINASSALGAASGAVSSETLAFVNQASPGKFLALVVIGTIIGGLTGEAFGTPKTASVDTLDLTSALSALGIDVPKNALIVYASAVNGYFTTAHLTGTDTHVPDWLGTLFTLSGIVIPGVAAGFNAANAAPAAGKAAAGIAPATP